MLPRISAALIQFIAPITTAGADKQEPQSQRPFERFRDPEKKPAAKVIPIRPAKTDSTESTESKSPPPTLPASITQSLLQLTLLLQSQTNTLRKWLALGKYQSASRQQKKNGRARKGTLIDHKSD